VLADDWINPQRPKPDLMQQEFELIVQHALRAGRITPDHQAGLHRWFDAARRLMAACQPGEDDPAGFKRQVLQDSLAELKRQVQTRLPGQTDTLV
jgi:glucosyl-3-phosphoglycerate synthase